jgi:hypothetical protein
VPRPLRDRKPPQLGAQCLDKPVVSSLPRPAMLALMLSTAPIGTAAAHARKSSSVSAVRSGPSSTVTSSEPMGGGSSDPESGRAMAESPFSQKDQAVASCGRCRPASDCARAPWVPQYLQSAAESWILCGDASTHGGWRGLPSWSGRYSSFAGGRLRPRFSGSGGDPYSIEPQGGGSVNTPFEPRPRCARRLHSVPAWPVTPATARLSARRKR